MDYSELKNVILPLIDNYDQLPLECDGMSRLLSHEFYRLGLVYNCYMGEVSNGKDGSNVYPHFWVELPVMGVEPLFVDLRLRMWLGDREDVPHGIFLEKEYPHILYTNKQYVRTPPLSDVLYKVLSSTH